MGKVIDITGKTFGEWKVLRRIEGSNWLCKCSCGKTEIVHSYRLRKGLSKSCGHSTTGFRDIAGETFGEWKVLRRQEGKWLCECSCGKQRLIRTVDLTTGHSKSCGHNTTGFKDLVGKAFGDWIVLEYLGNQLWKCRCSCGNESNIHTYKLTSGQSKSCGHGTTKFKDITGQTIGYWKVLRYLGDRYWECQCNCGNIRYVHAEALNTGKSLSCGCMSRDLASNTMLDKYGVTHLAKLNTARTQEQLNMVDSKQSLVEAIKTHFVAKPYICELSSLLGITDNMVLKYIHKYQLEDMVTIGNTHTSSFERELKQLYPEAKTDRKILNGHELDLYFDDIKTAVEFNGNYWHSDIVKDKLYHQRKTLECDKNGVRLIHIFEYEWNNVVVRNKILSLIDRSVKPELNRVLHARSCQIREISSADAKEFNELYHLQGACNSSVKLGIFNDNELVGTMLFGVPRFNSDFQYELLRITFKDKVVISGGTKKLFNYFVKKYSPDSIISYCDISKFLGNVYEKLGFNKSQLTSPNYVWVHNNTGNVLKRYDTMIHKLVEKGLAENGDTESTVMERLGYMRIYDCGNIRFEWRR